MHVFCANSESIVHSFCWHNFNKIFVSKNPLPIPCKRISSNPPRAPQLSVNGLARVHISWVPSIQSRKSTVRKAFGIASGFQAEEEKLHISEGKLLSEMSTWGIGGPAKYFVEVHSEIQLLSALRYCYKHNLRFFILGKGSNCLFDDRGFDGCVMLNRIDFIQAIYPATFRVGSGYAFNQLGLQCSKDGFIGLEFATGIPGTVGGAVFMNAGAGGQETADVLKFVEIVMIDGRRKVFPRSELNFSYRKSPFQNMQEFAAIVSATFELASFSSSRERQKLFLERRKRTQPIGQRSAGCVFRNPTTTALSAGALIEQAGLKGMTHGGAKVSEMHANFLINAGNSTSADMLSLIKIVKEQVRQKVGVELQEEILYVPYN